MPPKQPGPVFGLDVGDLSGHQLAVVMLAAGYVLRHPREPWKVLDADEIEDDMEGMLG